VAAGPIQVAVHVARGDKTFRAQPVDPQNANDFGARLDPFSLVAENLHDNSRLRRFDAPPVKFALGDRDIMFSDSLRDRGNLCPFARQLRSCSLRLTASPGR